MEARNVKRFWSRQGRKRAARQAGGSGRSARASYRPQRSLLAEALEQRDLLAGDMFSPPVDVGPVGGAGQFCVATCDPTIDQVTAQQQQRSAAGNQGPTAGRGATPLAAARARAAAQLRDRVNTPGDCQVGDGTEPIQQRDRLNQASVENDPVQRQDQSAQANRQVGDRLTPRDRDRLADCDNTATPLAERIGAGQTGRNGGDNQNGGPVGDQIGQRPGVPIVTGDLTEAQEEGVLQMRTEEKLAHDVYVTLGETWTSATIFTQIAQAESQHMAAVGGVIERYGLEDPIEDLDVGEFNNPTVQELYDNLVAQGKTSRANAYQVGATIEDMDIADLQTLDDADLPSDVARVYDNLERGSRNHLRAFVGQIEAIDETYDAQYLSAEEITAIVSSPIETGRGTGGGGTRMDRPGRKANVEQGRPGDAVRDRDTDSQRDRNTDAARDRVMDPDSACDQVFAELGRVAL